MAVELTPNRDFPNLVQASCTSCGVVLTTSNTEVGWAALVPFAEQHDAECSAVRLLTVARLIPTQRQRS